MRSDAIFVSCQIIKEQQEYNKQKCITFIDFDNDKASDTTEKILVVYLMLC